MEISFTIQMLMCVAGVQAFKKAAIQDINTILFAGNEELHIEERSLILSFRFIFV